MAPSASKDYPIIFTHVPRSAGTTLVSILNRQFKKEEKFFFYVREKAGSTQEAFDEYSSIPEAGRKRLKLLQGHTYFGIHALYPTYTYITLFRDPVERVISYYYYIMQEKDHYLHRVLLNSKMRLGDFVSSGIALELDNIQTRQLAGVRSKSFEKCTAAMLATAKENLSRYYLLFGFTDRFDEILLLMATHFGWQYPFYKSLNVIDQRPLQGQISPGTLDLIRKKNGYDIELYQFAKVEYQKLMDRQGAAFHKRLQRFQKYNAIMQKISRPYTGNMGLFLWDMYVRATRR
jgi:sulfotransferase famil protein